MPFFLWLSPAVSYGRLTAELSQVISLEDAVKLLLRVHDWIHAPQISQWPSSSFYNAGDKCGVRILCYYLSSTCLMGLHAIEA